MGRLFLLLLTLSAAAHAAEPELLEPDKAFRLSARVLSDSAIEVAYTIAPGYYLYRERFKFQADPGPAALGTAEFPPGKVKHDEFFGRVETYRDEVRVRIPVSRFENTAANLKLKATSQGCADIGVCFPPNDQTVYLKLAGNETGTLVDSGSDVSGPVSLATLRAAAPDAPGLPDVPLAKAPRATLPQPESKAPDAAVARQSETDRISSVLSQGRLWKSMAWFFAAGLLLAFTPCVLPMVPIISGIIAGQGQTITRRRGFLLSLTYVLGMAVTYTLVGVAAGLSGVLLSNALQNPWVLGAFALIFVALSLAMFDVYQLELPTSWQAKLSATSNRLSGGRIAAVAGMGVLSALIVGPCVTAPLAGAVLFIAQSRDVVLGGAALFSLAIGMGVPILLVGTSAGALLPRAGPWMDAVKRVFGFLLLGLAIWLVSPVLPTTVSMLLWGGLLIVAAMFLRAIDPLSTNASGYSRLAKGIGVIALVGGIGLLVGALSGGSDLLRPLGGLRAASGPDTPAKGLKFQRVASVEQLDSVLKTSAGKFVMLDFYADWCASCKEMEHLTFADATVQQRLQNVVLLQADVTENSGQDQALLRRFGLLGPPGIILFGPDGREIQSFRVIGYKSSEEFLAELTLAMGSERLSKLD